MIKLFIFLLTYTINITDYSTHEKLSGVQITTTTNTYYTNQFGNVEIPDSEKIINISYISYQDNNNSFTCKSDTVIQLKSH